MGTEVRAMDRLTVYLLRHGEPRFPDERRYVYGHTDWPLSEDGIRQARLAAEALSAVKFGAIWSSDLARAAMTAQEAAARQSAPPEIVYDEAFREMSLGDWEGMLYDDVRSDLEKMIMQRSIDASAASAPGGETFADVQARSFPAFMRAVDACAGVSDMLLAAHGGTLWTIVSKLFDLPLGDMNRFGLDFCAIHVVQLDRRSGAWKLIRYNWSPSLTGWLDYPTERRG